MKVRYFE